MTIRQMLLLMACLLLGTLALAQPEAPGANQGGKGKGDRQPKPAPAVITLQGAVKAVTTGKGAAGMVEMTLTTADKTTHVLLAPQPFLTNINLTVKAGDQVTVNGWEQAKAKEGRPVMFQARDLVLAGKTYVFRNEKGQPLWNAVEFLPKVTLAGTIKELITPEPKPAAGAQAKPAAGDAKPADKPKAKAQREPGFILTTDKGDVTIIGAPAAEVEKLGLKLEAGLKVTVAGWQQDKGKQTAVLVHAITAGEKTVTLRDDAGKPVWQKKAGKPAGRGGKGKERNPEKP